MREEMTWEARTRMLARTSHRFRAVRADPYPGTVLWPGASYDSIWVGEDIRRLVPPRKPVYNRLDQPHDVEYINRMAREIHLVIGRRIRSNRIMHGMRQVDLAACLGISTSSLCRIEQGKKAPTFALTVMIATQLAVPIEELINPPADHQPNEWVRRRRRRQMTTQEETELKAAIFEEELPDLMEFYGVTTREEVEAKMAEAERSAENN